MSDIASYKPSLSVTDLLSEELRNDSENFTLFLKAYYEWLQTVKVTFTDDSGTFQRDETITGDSSLATAVVKQVDTANNVLVVRMSSLRPFDLNETFAGGTSNATATILSLKDNVVRQTGQILNHRDATKTVDKYVEYLKNELYSTIPPELYADERLVARKFKEFFKAKSNEDSYKFLFRVLYGEDIEIRYPGEDLLRVSDGKYEKTTILRAVVTDGIFNFLNQTVVGASSDAVGNVVDIKVLNVGSTQVAEMTLALVSGTFQGNEIIEVIDTPTTNTTIYGMVTGFTINDAGSGYAVGDTITISSNTGNEAEAVISSIKSSPITSIKVNTNGFGYRLNVNAAINNTGTGGTGFAVRVTEIANTYTAGGYTVGETATISIINRGSGYFAKPTITLEDTTISALGLLSPNLITIANTGINYAVGDTLVFTGGSGSNAAGKVAAISETTSYNLLFEDGFRMLSEDSYYDIIKNEDWSVTGGISRLELTNFGTGYTSANLPTITVTTSTGSGANLIVTNIQGKGANVEVDVANNATGIGSIRAITLNDFGVGYVSATANASSSGDGNANLTPIISGVGIKEGNWVNDDGKIDYKIIQDSDYYQDFSYVIRSGLVFDRYSDIVKEVIHPAGMQFFGEILIQLELDLTPTFITTVETLANVISYVYIFELFGTAAAVPVGIVGNIKTLTTLENVIAGQTNLYSALHKVIQIHPEIDLSPIISSTVQLLSNVNEYVVFLENFIDTHSAIPITQKNIVSPQIQVATQSSALNTQYNEILELNANVVSDFNREILVSVPINITSTVSSTTTKLSLSPNYDANAATNPIGPVSGTIGDSKISWLAAEVISSYANSTFESDFLRSVTTYSKISGTVTVSGNTVTGNGTSFTSAYTVGADFIVIPEKFIVKSIANSTYLELNVNASASYNDVPAYA